MVEYSLKYCVGTTAEMKAEKDMESKIYFVVYENPPDDVALPVASDKRPWKSCGCIDKGFVSITASLSKACYQAGEKIATATLEVDNISISRHPIVVSATLNRLLNMKAEGHILISESTVKLGEFDKILPNKRGGCSVPAIQ